jgi:acetyltransferase-like isoleucine patch superfamily enzyme
MELMSGPHWKRREDPLKLVPRGLTKLYSLWVSGTYPFLRSGRKLSVHYTCDIRNPDLMELGNDVIIHKDVWLHAWPSGDGAPGPAVVVGDRCLIGRRSHISGRNGIVIEPDVIVSAGVLIQDHGHAYEDVTASIRLQGLVAGGRIRVGQGSWIGQGAAIVCTEGDLVLGPNCVVAANAVVTRSAPGFSVLVGNPARVVKQFDQRKGAWVLGSSSPAAVGAANGLGVRRVELSGPAARSPQAEERQ